MTYFADLSAYEYGNGAFNVPGTKNVGWLKAGKPFSTAEDDDEILGLVWDHCRISVAQTRGLHECEFCVARGSNVAERNGQKLLLGSAEVRVFSAGGDIYAAPNLIYHYMATHRYAPPAEFMDALRSGLRPGSQQYLRRLAELGLEWRKTPVPGADLARFEFVQTPKGVKKVRV